MIFSQKLEPSFMHKEDYDTLGSTEVYKYLKTSTFDTWKDLQQNFQNSHILASKKDVSEPDFINVSRKMAFYSNMLVKYN